MKLCEAPKKYTTEDVCRITGLSSMTLKYLLYAKRFNPSWPSSGKRQRNYYSESDIELLKKYKATNPMPKYDLLKGHI